MIPLFAFHPPVIAHRGAGMTAPENTLASVRHAAEQGAKWIEIDVKITYDGVPILMHDETLDRTTDGTGLVAETTWEQMRELDAGIKFSPGFKGERIPTLSVVMEEIVKAGMNALVELKPCPGRSRATTMVTIIEMAKIWPEKDALPIVSSFDPESLEIAAQMEPHWPRCLQVDGWRDDWTTLFERVSASAVTLPEKVLTPERVDQFNRLRIPLLAYTVNDPVRATDLLAQGVTAVYSGHPGMILENLKA